MSILFFVGSGYKFRPKKLRPLDDVDQRLQKTKGRSPKRRKPQRTKVKEMDRTQKIKNEDYMERAHGPQTMWKDHAKPEWSKQTMIERNTEIVRSARPKIAEGGKIVHHWVLVKLIEKVLTMFGDDPGPVKVKRYEDHPVQLYKMEDGIQYHTKLEIDHGVPNRYMKNSLKANGQKSIWFPQFAPTGSKDGKGKARINYSGRAYSQAGANRQGFGHWGLTTSKQGEVTNTADYLTPDDNSLSLIHPSYIYKYFGLPSYGMMSNYFGDQGLTSKVRFFLNSSQFKKDMMVDLYTNIMSRYSIHTYYNAMKYTDVNIKLYICRLKDQMRDVNIFNDICYFGNTTAASEGMRVPKKAAIRGVADATEIGMNVNLNWFDIEKDDIRWANGTTTIDGVTTENVLPWLVELSTVLGLTPQQSQTFRAHWDVIDVIDNNLGPNDSWEFTIEEKYKKSFSVKKWVEFMGNFSEQAEYDDYTHNQKKTHEGDVIVLPVFSGSPSGNFELKESDENLQAMPVDAAPSRIRHNVRHGMSISWPKAVDVRTYTGDQDINWENQGWSIVQQRSNFTGRANWPFGYEDSRIRITTSSDDEAGGAKSDV